MSDLHTSALHPSEVHASTTADGQPILTTGPMTPSIDFNPSEFKSSQDIVADESAHANPHPVVAKSGIDLSTGVTRPAETHANSGTYTESSEPTVTGLRQRAGEATNTAGAKANDVANAASQKAGEVRDNAGKVANNVSAKANEVGNTISAKANAVGQNVSAQLEHVAEHPAVQNAKQAAIKQTDSFREVLGRYPIIVNAEKQTGVDRVALVVGGVFLYLLLIPFNLFGLALPTTQLLTFLPPTFLALRTLDNPNEERTKTLLSYFVVFGFVQFAESLMAGFLEKRIPQYYTVKLLFLAYLIHPKTKGARKIHASVLRPLLVRAQQTSKQAADQVNTPPTTKPSSGSNNSPNVDVPLSRTSGYTSTQPGAPAGYSTSTSSSAFSGQGQSVGSGTIHLPSGGGSGVGQEVPKY